MSKLKDSDPVFVHPKHGTVHEAGTTNDLACGNPFGKIPYLSMTRAQARGRAGTKPCNSLACDKARA
jgi:hypothetical protein